MFTGIVEDVGYVKNFIKLDYGAELEIGAEKIFDGTKIGDSICVNGVCQTVVEINPLMGYFKTKVSDETLKVTNFKSLKSGDCLNLERALTLETRLGGHIVSGHVDCVAKLIELKNFSQFTNLKFEIPENYVKYIVKKGSIAINGISLTVADIENNIFSIAVIPHTMSNTSLRFIKRGNEVNIEVDILGKYVEKILTLKDNKSDITLDLLKENGFA